LLDWWLEHDRVVPVRGIVLICVFMPVWAMGFVELARLASACGVKLLAYSGLAGTLLLTSLLFWIELAGEHGSPMPAVLLVLSALTIGTLLEQMIRHRTEGALVRVASTLGAAVYLGVGGALILLIRLAFGVPSLVVFLAVVKCTDIGAYFVGSAFGKHKLVPWLSPGKSWEGLAGGLALAAGVGALGAWLLTRTGTPAFGALFGLIVGLAGQFGDLCESLLKRSAGAKDSASLVPTFGGILDIIDSPLLAAPPAVLLLALID